MSPEPFHVEGCHNRGIIVALHRLAWKLRGMVSQFCVVLPHNDSGLTQVVSIQSRPDSVAQTREIFIVNNQQFSRLADLEVRSWIKGFSTEAARRCQEGDSSCQAAFLPESVYAKDSDLAGYNREHGCWGMEILQNRRFATSKAS